MKDRELLTLKKPLPRKRTLRSEVQDCIMVEFEYEDEILKMISKSSRKDYDNQRAEIPEEIEFYEKEWFLHQKRKELQKRKVIDLER